MIHLNNLSLSFGLQKIFDDLDLTIAPSDRIGLVGRNGSGKTTLLKAIAERKAPDSGTITCSDQLTIAYLPQEVVLKSDLSILEETLGSYKTVGALRCKARALEQRVRAADPEAVQEYGQIAEQLAGLNVDYAVRTTEELLFGLGFKHEQLQESVASLSVGWQMRVVLAKLLVQGADFYLFDEPTNHLDIVAKDWFLGFLKEAKFGFMLVSHDRYFLDQLCTKIFELEYGKGVLYQGNYEHYETQKAHATLLLRQAFEQQQKTLKRKQEWVDRFRAKSSKAKLVKSVERSLEKIERIELPPDPQSIHFTFKSVQRSGRVVLEVQNISYSFGQKPVFQNVSFSVERGQKVAVVAPNGVGKTTLFNVLRGKYKPGLGTIKLGYNVQSAIFEQEQHKVLDPKKTILQEVMDHAVNKSEQEVRTFLGSFLFSKDQVVKKTGVLSGGERNRVSMVKVLLQDANFLLLDEPTNHLDIQSKEILLQALTQFDGTILFVSHDRDFVNKLATHIFELSSDGIASYCGNYDSFLAQKAALGKNVQDAVHQDFVKKETPENTGKQQLQGVPKLRKHIHKLERTIAKLEASIEKIGFSFAHLEYGTPEFQTAQQKLQEKEAELARAMSEWEKAQSSFE